MDPFRSTNLIFHNDETARAVLEALRWPDGPVCPKILRKTGGLRCGATGTAVAELKQSHRRGLFRCKSCRGQFTVTVGTVFANSKVPLSKWLQAVHKVGYSEKAPTLVDVQKTIGVTYKTTLQMWSRICAALRTYKGYKKAFGTKARAVIEKAQPKYVGAPPLANYRPRKNKLLAAGNHPSQHKIPTTGLLSSFDRDGARSENLERTERLLRLLLATDPKPWRAEKKRASKRSRLKRGMI